MSVARLRPFRIPASPDLRAPWRIRQCEGPDQVRVATRRALGHGSDPINVLRIAKCRPRKPRSVRLRVSEVFGVSNFGPQMKWRPRLVFTSCPVEIGADAKQRPNQPS